MSRFSICAVISPTNSSEIVISARVWGGKKKKIRFREIKLARVRRRKSRRARFPDFPLRDEEFALKNSRETSGLFIFHFSVLHYISTGEASVEHSIPRDGECARNAGAERYISIYQLSPGFHVLPNTFAKRHITSKLSFFLSFLFLLFLLFPFPPLMIMVYNRLPFAKSRGDKESRAPESLPFDLRKRIMTVIDGIVMYADSLCRFFFYESRLVRISPQKCQLLCR